LSLIPGTRLGVYDITAQIGEGGMGAVYRATDTSLGRQVAIKVLPDAFAQDAERLARFEREAKTLASLNHPNIAAIYGLERSSGTLALVMELVEGDDLSQRISRGAIPIDEALPIAKQIAEALETAHEQGIIHRDLKPANIKVRSDGTVKVLDFGLAKAMEPAAGSSPSMSMSPTLSMHATQAGIILGTAAYMSPEQAAGKPVDKRSDLWSFGVVLLEMLTGRPVFGGETISHVLASVLKDEPDWTTLPAATPPPIRRLLRRCLEKDRKRRLDSAVAARIEIEDALSAPAGADPSVLIAHPHRNRERAAWALAAVALVAAAVFPIAYWRPAPRDTAVVRFTIPPPKRAFLTSGTTLTPEIAISPDGKTVAFVAEDGSRQLWVRAIDAVESRLMPGTDGAFKPFWSPDSTFIGFGAGGKIKKIALDGGSPQSICDIPDSFTTASGSWNRDGVIIFPVNRDNRIGIYRVSAAGGQASPLTTLKDKETAHVYPSFLPDGQHFLYLVRSPQADIAGVYVGALDSKDTKRILDLASRSIYSAGHLLFVRDGKLMAQSFDAVHLETRGDPFLVANAVAASGDYSSMSASDAGVLAYGGESAGGFQLAWFDRTGRPLGTLGSPDRYMELRLSPDGQRVALARTDPKVSTWDLWLADVSSGIFSRFTSDPGNEADPVWSPDGHQIAFWSNRTNANQLYIKTLGASEEAVLFEANGSHYIDDWTKDGRFVIFRDGNNAGSSEYALPMFGEDRKPILLLKDPFSKDEFNVSPDGRWIAFNSSESEKTQVYVAAFPSMTDRRQVSSDGGGIPKWRRDGKELYYLSADGKLMALDVRSTGTTIETGAPKMLFQTPINVALGQDKYDVTADGQKFLLLQPAEQTTVPPITVVVNWLAGLNKK
jgi:serine/threonine protein kinase/Tol biopolymer transport system component